MQKKQNSIKKNIHTDESILRLRKIWGKNIDKRNIMKDICDVSYKKSIIYKLFYKGKRCR